MSERAKQNKVVKESHLDFLEEMHSEGVPLDIEQIKLLVDAKRITIAPEPEKERKTKAFRIPNSKQTAESNIADQYIDIIEEGYVPEDHDDPDKVLDGDTFDKIQEGPRFTYQGGLDITKNDWKPDSIIEHKDDFILWINSINSGFQGMVKYDKFRIYCQQAKNWLDDHRTMYSLDTRQERIDYGLEEMRRCKENTLYFMDKYLKLKEGSLATGSMDYKSKPVHKVICFMIDSGYSFMMGKPRQIAATSTLGGCAVAKVMFNKNFFLKFITMDKESGIEIFEDKIKHPFSELPDYMKPEVSNDRENLFKLSAKGTHKGTKKGNNSSIRVVAPSVSAINGGSPNMVMVDEAGYIGMLSKMLKEARPTMFMFDEATSKLIMRRQVIIWGTGGTSEGERRTKTKAYETEFYDAMDHWGKKNFKYGIVPLFFDWTTRMGMSKDFYESEKRAYTVEGPERQSRMIQFRQHYPSVVEDMFLTSSKLLVDVGWITQQTDRIKNMSAVLKPQKGYFEPVYDETKPTNESSDVPFKIIGANFVPLDDTKDNMDLASCTIFLHPKKGWLDRYYMGTDPIMTDNGYSNMASVVFDAHYNTPVASVNYRDPDHKGTFLQCLLLGLYYDTRDVKVGIPELIEANIGTAYMDYKEDKGFERSIVQRTELPNYLAGGGSLYGIDNKGNRTRFIISKMTEVVTAFGDKFCLPEIFHQLRTFSCTVTDKGNETWGTVDKRKFHDDILFGLVFSYICAISYSHRPPRKINQGSEDYRWERRLVRGNNHQLSYTQVKVPNR